MPKQDRDPVPARGLDTDAARAQAIVSSLRVGEPSSAEVFEAFAEFDALPRDVVRHALASWMGPLVDVERMDNATRVAHGLPLHPLHLRTLEVTKDADVLDGGPIAEEQLRLAGKTWDGLDLSPEDRLDGELEGSFAGTLERHVLIDADAPGNTALFDVLLFAEHAGVVFDAGTTKQVALIAYGKVETRDRRTALGIEQAIAGRLAEAPLVPAPVVVHAPVVHAPVAHAPVAPTAVARAVAAHGFVRAVARKPRVAAKMTAASKPLRGRAGVQKRKS